MSQEQLWDLDVARLICGSDAVPVLDEVASIIADCAQAGPGGWSVVAYLFSLAVGDGSVGNVAYVPRPPMGFHGGVRLCAFDGQELESMEWRAWPRESGRAISDPIQPVNAVAIVVTDGGEPVFCSTLYRAHGGWIAVSCTAQQAELLAGRCG